MSSLEQQEIPQGYKQTEVGVIPEDWSVKPLSAFISALEAGVSVNSVEKYELSIHDKFVLKTSCIFGGYFDPREAKSILPKDLNRAKLNPRRNSILVSRMNTPALVGEVGFIEDDYSNLYLPDRLWQTKYKNDKSVDGKWLSFILSFPRVAKKIKETATGTSNSMKNISKGSFLSVTIPAPEIMEQTAIANALFDVDALITSLEKLITKKRAIKTAAMQQLLTGKKRLPPFDTLVSKGSTPAFKQTELGEIPEDWELLTIGDITTIVGDGIHATPIYSSSGEYYFINGNNIDNGLITITENTKRVNLEEYQKHKKDLSNRTIFLSINGTIGNLAFYNDEQVVLGKSAAYFNIKENYSKFFIFYSLKTNVVKKYFQDGLTGTTIKNLGLGVIRSTPIPIPLSAKEQAAIASVLSDMDKEIEAIKQRLNKTQQLKQGMMQELLTGRTRLI